MDDVVTFDGASFKDPSGRVFERAGRIFRTVTPDAQAQFDQFVSSGLYDELHDAGSIVRTALVPAADGGVDAARYGPHLLEHERIPYVSYPYEWSFDMLRDAALLTLDILDRALDRDFVLKDATPFNIQFRDGRPVFIDILSIEAYRKNTPWMGYQQFCSMFLFPLMLTAYRGMDFHALLRGSLGMISATDMAGLLHGRDVFRPGVLTHVKLAARLQRSFQDRPEQVKSRFSEVGFAKEMIRANVARLRKTLRKLQYRAENSAWAEYETSHSYSDADRDAKHAFVEGALQRVRPAWVWDLGCNTGEYSQRAADGGARVLAIDGDPACVNRLYCGQKAGKRSPRILGLVGDLANPTPAIGWALHERKSWFDRGQADLALALALVHHLAIGANIPLPEIAKFLRAVAPNVVVEFVTKADPMVERLLATREDVFTEYGQAQFESALGAYFQILRRERNSAGTRILYELGPAA